MSHASSRFCQNLEYWARICPEGAHKVKELSSIPTPSIASQAQLKEKAARWFSTLHLKYTSVLYVYGLEEGFIYAAAKNWLEDSEHYLVLLEHDVEAIRRFLETESATELLKNKQVRLYLISLDFQEDEFWKQVTLLYISYEFQLVASPSYAERFSQELQCIQAKLSFWENINRCWMAEYLDHGVLFYQNYYQNLLRLPQSYLAKQLYNKFTDIPAIICGAGPSLQKQIPLLKTVTERALIFAGGTAMNALNAHGLTPHFGLGLDPYPDQYARLLTQTGFETPFFYRNRIYKDALELIHGPKLFVNGSLGYNTGEWIEKELGISGTVFQEGLNVVNFSIALAKELGCNPIILVGVDLAYTREQGYATGVSRSYTTKRPEEELVYLQDIYGKPVHTLWKWISEAAWISHFAKQHPEHLVINSTEGGIGMQGISNIPFSEVKKGFLEKEYPLSALVHGEIQCSTMPETVSIKSIRSLLDSLKASLQRCQTFCNMRLSTVQETYSALRQEIGYTALLKNFDEAYWKFLGLQRQNCEYEAKNKKCSQDIYQQQFSFLQKTAQIQEILLSTLTFPEEEVTQPMRAHAPLTMQGSMQDKLSLFSSEGTLLAEVEYKEGRQHGLSRLYYANGALYAEQHFKNGLLDGPQEYYYRNGTQQALLSYKNGLLEGKSLLFFQNEAKKREVTFALGKREGQDLLWNARGTLCMHAEYAQGNPIGVTRMWHSNGRLSVEAHYDPQGALISYLEFDEKGQPVDLEGREEEYFNAVTKRTKTFSDSLRGMSHKIHTLMQEMPEDSTMQENWKQVNQLLNELQTYEERLFSLTGLKENQEEAFWKTPSARREMNEQLEKMTVTLTKEIQQLETALNKLKQA